MSSVTRTDTLIRRLRAHQVIPPGATAALERGPASLFGRAGVKWRVVSPSAGTVFAASAFTVSELAACPRWQFRRKDDVTWVEPEGTGPDPAV